MKTRDEIAKEIGNLITSAYSGNNFTSDELARIFSKIEILKWVLEV